MEMGLYEREVALAYDPFVGGNVVLESLPLLGTSGTLVQEPT
jgi:hypothetical protein